MRAIGGVRINAKVGLANSVQPPDSRIEDKQSIVSRDGVPQSAEATHVENGRCLSLRVSVCQVPHPHPSDAPRIILPQSLPFSPRAFCLSTTRPSSLDSFVVPRRLLFPG